MKISQRLKSFLKAAVDPSQFENNPILQDHMTPELVDEIEKLIANRMKLKEYKFRCRSCGHIATVSSDEELRGVLIMNCPKCGKEQVFERVVRR